MHFIWTRKGGQSPWEKMPFGFSVVTNAERVASWIRIDQPSLDVILLPNGVAPCKEVS